MGPPFFCPPQRMPPLCKGRWHGAAVTEGLLALDFPPCQNRCRRGGHCPPAFLRPHSFLSLFEKEKNRRGVRRSQLHCASAGAAKAPYSQPPSSFPKADRCAGSPFGSNKKRKETTGEPFEWFPGPSIDQRLALDLRRMEVGKPTIEYVEADAERSCSRRRSVTDAACPLRVLIDPYKHNRSAAQDREKQSASLWTEGGA